jgi:hypothetical protein
MIKIGDRVRWDGDTGAQQGAVSEIVTESVIRSLQGEEVTRHGTPDNPALIIEQEDGRAVMKLASEVERT